MSSSTGSLVQSLHLSEEKYRLLVEAVSDYAIFLLDPHGIVSSWNKGARHITGYTADEIIGHYFSRFYPEESIELGWPEHELQVAKLEGRFEDEGWRIRKDGSRYWSNVIITALYDDDGLLWGYSKITRDLTERRLYEESLRQSEERFRLLVEGVRDCAIFLLSPQGIVSSWNAGAEQIKGYKASDIIGQHFSRFYPREKIEQRWPEHELEIARADGRYEEEGWRIRKDGSRFWASVSITALHDPDGELYGFAKVTRDLSERKRIEALELAEQRMNEFLAMLSHELRNPLAPMRSALSVMQMAKPEDPAQKRSREVIERQVNHITRLVDDLLDVSRVTAGAIKLVREPVDIAEVVARAVETSQPLIEARGHHFEQSLPDAKIMVKGDLVRLTQVLINLLNNAAQYTSEGGEIKLSVTTAADLVIIRVRDNGEGIPPELLPEVFSLFTQGERALDRAQGGLGIGLTLARQLIEMQGGSINVSSDGTDQGSEFVIRLPLLEVRPPAPAVPEPHRLDGPSPSLRILMVEDLPDVAEGMRMILEIWGHEVMVVEEGAKALDLAAWYRPEVVLLDIGLPGMSGYEVARQLRKLPELDNAILIALTGYGQKTDRDKAYAAGFDHHLVKGGSLEGLRNLLRRD